MRTRFITVCVCLACTGRALGSVAAMGKESKMEWNVVSVNEISISQPGCLSSQCPYFYMWGLLAASGDIFGCQNLEVREIKSVPPPLSPHPVCVHACVCYIVDRG